MSFIQYLWSWSGFCSGYILCPVAVGQVEIVIMFDRITAGLGKGVR